MGEDTKGFSSFKTQFSELPSGGLNVSKDEIEALMLIPVPPHPDVVFDDDEWRMLVAIAHSMTTVEKIKMIAGCARFSQRQVDKVLEILRGERKNFELLNEKNQKRIEALARLYEEERKERESRPVEPKPTTSDLAPGEKAGIVYKAIRTLLAPIGAGEGQKFFTRFLQRLAWQIEQGGTDVVEGELPTVFEAELRNPELNKNASDPSSDARFINALVRPVLSKLGRARSPSMVLHKGSMFVVALVMEGPEVPGGRVRQPYRIGVFVRLDSDETTREHFRHEFISYVVSQVAARGQELIQIERLGPFGPVVRRVVEKAGYASEAKRAESTFHVTAAVLGNILSAMRNDQRLPFLMHLLGLPVRWSGAIPTEDFDNWFINAVEFNDGLTLDDENYDFGGGRFQIRLRYSPFAFPIRLLLLKAYHLAPAAQRRELTVLLSVLDQGRVPSSLTEADTIYRPPETVDLQRMLAMNISDVADFLRLVEAQALDDFAT